MRPTLYIGNKNYSSWSMRPWLAMRWAGIDFEEVTLPLGGIGYGKSRIPAVRAVSPSGRVPALRIGDTVIHDSLGIAEWVVEQAPTLYPADPLDRALCRSAVAEMHSGFAALRRDLSMNVRRRVSPRTWPWPDDVRSDIDRVFEAWQHDRARFGAKGPYLFGERTLADAFYAPVCTRFRTYGVAMPPVVAAYCDTIFADADFRLWEQGALAEPWSIPETDALYA
jgi:glutathione S-transferase